MLGCPWKDRCIDYKCKGDHLRCKFFEDVFTWRTAIGKRLFSDEA